MQRQEVSISYYDDNSRINNSAIIRFLDRGPSYFIKYIRGELPKENSQSMLMGSVIHKYILEKSDFYNTYMLDNAQNKPKSNEQKKFIDNVMNNTEDEHLIKVYRDIYSVDKQSDDVVLKKALKLLEELSEYKQQLENSSNKTIISYSFLERCKTIEENIKLHKKAKEIVYFESDEWYSANEFHINWNYEAEYGLIECKSLLDRVRIKKDKSEIQIIDLKTTGNPFKFNKSFTEYRYDNQFCYYTESIKWYVKNIMNWSDEDINNTKITVYIVAIGTMNDIVVYSFDSEHFKDNYNNVLKPTMDEISWHYNNDLWDYDRLYYESDGSIPFYTVKNPLYNDK